MARIVSGQEELQDPGFAFLAGQQQGRQAGAEAQAQALRQMALMQEFQGALARTQEKREKLYQEELERREMEKAQNVQGQQLKQQAQGFLMPEGMQGPPTVQQEQLMTMLQAGEEIKTPEARKAYYGALEDTLKGMQSDYERQVAFAAIKNHASDGLIDEEEFMGRFEGGEPPVSLLKDIAQKKDEQTAASLSQQDSDQATIEAQAIVDALPAGRSKDAARIELTKWLNTPHLHSKPGAAQEMLASVRRAALLEENEKQALRDALIKRAQPPPRKGQEKYEWPETYGKREFTNFDVGELSAEQPRTPAMQEHIEAKRTEKEKRFPGTTSISRVPKGATPEQTKSVIRALIEETRDPVELAKRLKEQGAPLTEQTQAYVREILQERRTNAQAASGVER